MGIGAPEHIMILHRGKTIMRQVEIRVKGYINEDWSEWFDGLTIIHSDRNETIITGPIVDQSALYGMLNRLRDLGLPLVSVNRIMPQSGLHREAD